jgi:hypothetical protein
MTEARRIELSAGTIKYRDTGGEGPVVVLLRQLPARVERARADPDRKAPGPVADSYTLIRSSGSVLAELALPHGGR